MTGGGIHLFVFPAWLNALVVLGTGAVALWAGGWRERTIAGTHIAQLPVGKILCGLSAGPCVGMPWKATVDDLLLLGACLICLYRADRYWVVWATACPALMVLFDALGMAGASRWSWTSGNLGAAYILCGILLWGVRATARDRARAAGLSGRGGS